MAYRTKYDYQKHPRQQITTTINKDLYSEFLQLSMDIGQPRTKMYDIALKMILQNEQLKEQFIKNVRGYY